MRLLSGIILTPFAHRHLRCIDDPHPPLFIGVRNDDQTLALRQASRQESLLVMRRSGSSMVTAKGSPNTVDASSNDTPCLQSFPCFFRIPFELLHNSRLSW